MELCESYSADRLEGEDEEAQVILINSPHEPLYVKTKVRFLKNPAMTMLNHWKTTHIERLIKVHQS